MADIPVTSTTLLNDIAGDFQNARWGEFVARYRPMMEAYLQEHFPSLEPDDIIQETLVSLVAKLPTYRYVPNEAGHFRNYLTGILRRKALRVCTRNRRRGEVMEEFRHEPQTDNSAQAREEKLWREAVYEIALEQVLADETIQARTRQIFVRTAVNDEKPCEVADSLGISRNAVDQAKNRVIEKLREIVSHLEAVDAVPS